MRLKEKKVLPKITAEMLKTNLFIFLSWLQASHSFLLKKMFHFWHFKPNRLLIYISGPLYIHSTK